MKKMLLGFAALALVFSTTSCSKEFEKETLQTQRPMSFEVFTGKATKASEKNDFTTTDIIKLEVYAGAATTPTETVYIKKDGTNWKTYSDAAATTPKTFYYPAGNFVIYSNYNTAQAISNAGKVTYTVGDVADQEDYLVCYYSYTGTQHTGSTKLTFKHALSQVNFKIKDVKDLKIEVEAITVTVANNIGDYTLSTSVWDNLLPATGTITYNYDLTKSTKVTAGTTGNDDVSLQNTDKDNSLMLLPQPLTNAVIAVTYNIKDMADNVVVASNTVTMNLSTATVSSWLQKTHYTYLLNLGKVMSFSVAFEDWTTESVTDI